MKKPAHLPPRVDPRKGFVDLKEIPRGPQGNPLCRWCAKETNRSNRTFCGPECVHEWKIRTNPQYVRKQLRVRDRGICALCGVDSIANRDAYETLHTWEADHITPVVAGGGLCGLDGYRTLCVTCHRAETKKLYEKRKGTS